MTGLLIANKVKQKGVHSIMNALAFSESEVIVMKTLDEAKALFVKNENLLCSVCEAEGEQSAFSSLIEAIKWIVSEDLRDDISENDFPMLLYMITKINILYECVRAIVYHNFMKETENMTYFKFVRDKVSHPDKLDSGRYKKLPYQEYMKHILTDFCPTDAAKKYHEEQIKHLFSCEEEKEFVLVLNDSNNAYECVYLFCPYSKLWKCVLDLIRCLVSYCEVYMKKHKAGKDKHGSKEETA